MFADALGYDVGLTDLLLITISVSLLASFIPVAGGIGVAELIVLLLGLVLLGWFTLGALRALVLAHALATPLRSDGSGVQLPALPDQ
jgi:uncharacterized membrane protein YbhN (UPF0104 family)